jgi:hypothetical protein
MAIVAPLRAALALSVAGIIVAVIAAACAGEIRNLPQGSNEENFSEQIPKEAASQHEEWAVRGESWEAALRDTSLALAVLSIILSVVGSIALVLVSLRRGGVNATRTRGLLKLWVLIEVLLMLTMIGALITDLVFAGEVRAFLFVLFFRVQVLLWPDTSSSKIEGFCVNEEQSCAACNTDCSQETTYEIVMDCVRISNQTKQNCFYYTCDFQKLCEETPPLAVGVIIGLFLTLLFGALHLCVVWFGLDIISPRHERDTTFFGVVEVEQEDYGSNPGEFRSDF